MLGKVVLIKLPIMELKETMEVIIIMPFTLIDFFSKLVFKSCVEITNCISYTIFLSSSASKESCVIKRKDGNKCLVYMNTDYSPFTYVRSNLQRLITSNIIGSWCPVARQNCSTLFIITSFSCDNLQLRREANHGVTFITYAMHCLKKLVLDMELAETCSFDVKQQNINHIAKLKRSTHSSMTYLV